MQVKLEVIHTNKSDSKSGLLYYLLHSSEDHKTEFLNLQK